MIYITSNKKDGTWIVKDEMGMVIDEFDYKKDAREFVDGTFPNQKIKIQKRDGKWMC